MIELVGVLAIISIIAAALAPSIIKRIDRAAWTREVSDLDTMANGLRSSIVRDKTISDQANLPSQIYKYMDMGLSQVQKTPRYTDRYFVVDPSFKIGGTLQSVPPILPYVQGAGGATNPPVRTRVMVFSTIGASLPTQLGLLASSGGPSSTDFNNMWTTGESNVPTWLTQSPQNWKGKIDDLCIRRIDLSALFHKVYLQNIDRDVSHYGYYRIDTNGYATALKSPWASGANPSTNTLWVLDGTPIGLYQLTDPNNLQLRVLIRQDESYTYQNNQWSPSLSVDQVPPQGFGYWVTLFLNSPGPQPAAKFNATQRAIVDLFYDYMWAYWSWANAPQGPFWWDPAEGCATPQNPYFRPAYDAQRQLADYTYNLLNGH